MVPDGKMELDLFTHELLEFEVESFSEINGSERNQFISHKCYGRGKSLEDLTVPRMPFVCQNQKEDKHVMSASVSESCHSQRHTFKGRGRARLLKEQAEHMSSVPGHRSNSFKYIALNHIPANLEVGYSMLVQNTDGSYPTLTDSSCSQQMKMPPETCLEFSLLNISHSATHDGKCDKNTGKEKKKKIKYRSLSSFLTETCSEGKPRLKYLERNNYADVNHKPDSAGGHAILPPSLHKTAFLDADNCDFNHRLPTTFTHYVAKDLSKEEVSYDIPFESLGSQNEEDGERVDEKDVSCSDVMEKRITCGGPDAKHVSENISVAYTTSTMCMKINECCAIDISSQKLSTSAEGEARIKNLEDVNHPSENNNEGARNRPVVMNEENGEHVDEEDVMEKRITCDGSDAKHVSENISVAYTTSTMCEKINECCTIDNSSQKLSTGAEGEARIKDLEDVNHPSENKNKGTRNKPVTKKLYSSWKLEGSDVIQIDNVPKKCTKELETLVANSATVLASVKKTKKGTNSFRFKLNSREACDWAVSCLHKADIFPDTVLNCYLVEEELPNTEL